jgi:hypothetical protein
MALQPGQRLKLITDIAAVLAAKSWTEIDVHLRQFSLPWAEQWAGGDRHSYVMTQLEGGNDAGLTGLHDYLFPTNAAPAAAAVGGHWKPGCFRVFMSHITADKATISEMKTELSRYGIDSFVAHEDIEPTKEWVTEIEVALATCHATVAFLTPEFHSSKWTDQELGYCLHRGVLIVPIRLGCDPYGFLGRYQAPQGAAKTTAALASVLFNIFIEHELTAGEMASAVVNYFAASSSFNETRRRMQLVESITTWTPALLARLEASVAPNVDIRDCYGVPARIAALVRQHGGKANDEPF